LAPPRPYWKGYLKLSLVSCPIAIYSAVASGERIAFRQINRATGHRLRQQLVDEGTKEPVDAAEKARGYEVSKGAYLLVEDDELDALAIESSHTIDIDQFVFRAEIDERYLDSPYYLVPDDHVGEEAFAVIREAMREKGMVALGRVVLGKRERVMMLQPWGKGVMGTTLRYPYEVRDASAYFDDLRDISIPKDMLSLADHILETKRGAFDPQTFVDRYEEAVVDLLRKKQAGMPAPKAPEATRPANVVNLFEALKRSLDAEQKQKGEPPQSAARPAPPAKKPKKRAEGQRELLLPIAGKGVSKPAATDMAPAPKKAPARSGGARRKAS
jgi:DNA end-binding protein Ku